MAEDFGILLRSFRGRLTISQEELAERAQISPAAVSALERGTRRAPYRETVKLLGNALTLSQEERSCFESAARRARVRVKPADRALTGSLPLRLTSYVDNETTLSDLRALMTSHRCVTITGSGGVGKTRAAIEAVRDESLSMGHVRFADLSQLGDGTFLTSVLASALDAPLAEQDVTLERLATSLRSQSYLLVLDNCEHLLEAAAEAAYALLRACPNARILATSRERLNISGEVVYHLASLSIADGNDLQALRDSAAVQLFIDRAKLLDPQFESSDQRLALIADVCRRVDGIPLAIEIAASRLPALGLRALCKRLNDHFSIKVSGVDRPARQETMRATVLWSCSLLDESQRRLLRRLAVFAGSFSLEAATFVCSDIPEDEAATTATLLELVDKSLVEPIRCEDEHVRYALLDSVRAENAVALSQSGETDALLAKLGRWLVNLNASIQRRDAGSGRDGWLASVWPEFDNVRAALDFAVRSPAASDGALAARIVGDFRSMWIQTGRRNELARWAQGALERVDENGDPLVAARVWWALMFATKGSRTIAAANRASALFDRCGDVADAAAARGQLAYEYCRSGRYSEAEQLLVNAIVALRERGLTQSTHYVGALRIAAWVACVQDHVGPAFEYAREAMVIADRLDDELTALQVQACLAEIEFSAGDIERAIAISEAVLSRSVVRPEGARNVIESLCNLAAFRMKLDRIDAAYSAARGALVRAQGRYLNLTHWAIQHLAAVAALRGIGRQSGRLLGFVDRWVEGEGFVRHPVELFTYELGLRSLQQLVCREEAETYRAQGTRLTFESASEEAMCV